MGVTLTRAALKGGWYELKAGQNVFLGSPLTKRVKTFIGIAGVNLGAEICTIDFYFQYFRLCNNVTGFYPGVLKDGKKNPTNVSKFLDHINKDCTREGQHNYAMLSLYDASVGPYTYGKYTSSFPTQDE
jgi:triacylglycerol lipase